jgi:hypothetical protein
VKGWGGGRIAGFCPTSKNTSRNITFKQRKQMKTIKIINNRLRWLSLGVYLGAFIMCLIETYDKNNKKKNINWDLIPSSPGTEAYEPNFNNYKHNHQKAENNA